MMYGPGGGGLYALNVKTGAVHPLLEDPEGTVRDPHVHYDGKKILFSYRKGDSRYFHLYEVDADGANLRQLTDGPFDDLEPIYLPDGDLCFVSSRCKRWVQCWHTHVAVRFRSDPDGDNLQILSSNVEQDNTPWMMPDGRVLYMRWEYVDRSRVSFHHLWTSNPDGSGEMVYFGNMHRGTVMLDAKPIPDTDKVLSIFSPGHGRKEHAGTVTIVDPKAGPDDRSRAKAVKAEGEFRDPYPLSESLFLAATESQIVLMDDTGRTEALYQRGEDNTKYWLHEPRPLRPRARERIIPSRIDMSESTGRLILADVDHGRNMQGRENRASQKAARARGAAQTDQSLRHDGTDEPRRHVYAAADSRHGARRGGRLGLLRGAPRFAACSSSLWMKTISRSSGCRVSST